MSKTIDEGARHRFLVTGAAGFIGSNLCEILLASGHEVHGIDNLLTGNRRNLEEMSEDPKFRFFEFDLLKNEFGPEFISSNVTVIHLAALADIIPSITDPERYFENNVIATFRLMEACRRLGARKVVYAASSSCYGDSLKVPTDEHHPCNPRYPYALTKFMGEQLVMNWGNVYKIPTLSLRLFNVYGPRSRTSGQYGAVLGVFLAQKLAGKHLTIVGDGKQCRDFVHVRDVCDAFIKAATSELSNHIFNIGSGTPRTVVELANLISTKFEYIPKRPGEPEVTHADISKAKELLNWRPTISLEQGIFELMKDLRPWLNAPVWDANSIERQTAEWFRVLGG